MPPSGVKKGTKRARQYEHVKDSQRQRGAAGELGHDDQVLLRIWRAVAEAQHRQGTQRAPACGQRRHDRRAVSVVDHEARML